MTKLFDWRAWLGLPMAASEHGDKVDWLIVYVHWLMVALFVGWFAYFVYVLFRFRQSRHPKADHAGVKTQASNYIEGAVALVELVLLIGFAIPLWAKVADDFPKESDATVIRVIAQQFNWNARYPGKDGKFGKQDPKLAGPSNPFGDVKDDPDGKDDFSAPVNEIVVPVNKPVIIKLTSMDVIHCLKIIPLRVTQDAIPGLSIPVHFKPVKEGHYQINCAQLCGNSHYFMRGFFTVLSPADYEKWMAERSKSGAAVSFE